MAEASDTVLLSDGSSITGWGAENLKIGDTALTAAWEDVAVAVLDSFTCTLLTGGAWWTVGLIFLGDSLSAGLS